MLALEIIHIICSLVKACINFINATSYITSLEINELKMINLWIYTLCAKFKRVDHSCYFKTSKIWDLRLKDRHKIT